MATIKSYTDLEQSKKLTEILPIESADMMYQSIEDEYGDGEWEAIPRNNSINIGYDDDIPCWSLASLIDALPRIEGLKPVLDLEINCIQYPSDIDLSAAAGNPVDACYEMILKLHELKVL